MCSINSFQPLQLNHLYPYWAISAFRMFKKPRQKGFIGTLLCCFRPNVAQPSATNAEDAQSKVNFKVLNLFALKNYLPVSFLDQTFASAATRLGRKQNVHGN